MTNAVGTSVVVQTLLAQSTDKGVPIIAPFIRDYPELMYLGLDNLNRFDTGGTWMTKLTHAQKRAIQFKKVASLEADMSIEKNAVVWYEVGMFTETSKIDADVTAATSFVIDADDLKYFRVGDVVVIRPAVGSAGIPAQVEITAIAPLTNTVTVDSPITAEAGDQVVYAYTRIEECAEINRCADDDSMVPVKSYFQRFGGCVEFKMCDINTRRLVQDAKDFVSSKFSTVTNRANQNFANAFYLGRNIPGVKSETQGLDTLIAEKEARDGVGTALIDFSTLTLTTPEARLHEFVRIINDASSAPIYRGNEVPTVYVNLAMITRLSDDLRAYKNSMGGYNLMENKITFDLPAFQSIFFKNVQFIVSHTLNKLEPYRAVAYMFPKHLMTFKTPQYTLNENGDLANNNTNGYTIHQLPRVSVECIKFQMLMTIANVFGGQSYPNSYKKVTNY